jgi:hypothetical protein
MRRDVQSRNEMNLNAGQGVAVREFITAPGDGRADYVDEAWERASAEKGGGDPTDDQVRSARVELVERFFGGGPPCIRRVRQSRGFVPRVHQELSYTKRQ